MSSTASKTWDFDCALVGPRLLVAYLGVSNKDTPIGELVTQTLNTIDVLLRKAASKENCDTARQYAEGAAALLNTPLGKEISGRALDDYDTSKLGS
jgi:hypothetical protein